jgi:hypothetical protein
MKRLFGSLFVLTFLVSAAVAQKPDSSKTPDPKPVAPPSVKLPAAKDVVEKYVKAIGGKDAYLKHRSRVESGTIELTPMGLKGTYENLSVSDNRVFSKISIDGFGDVLNSFDGKLGWSSNPAQGSRLREGKELEQFRHQSIYDREVNPEKAFTSLVVRGVENVGDRKTYVLVGSTSGLPDEIIYFDVDSGLVLRRDNILLAPEGQQATTAFYEDYRDVGGVKWPFKTRAKTPAFELIFVVSEIKYDVPVEDSKFKRPN